LKKGAPLGNAKEAGNLGSVFLHGSARSREFDGAVAVGGAAIRWLQKSILKERCAVGSSPKFLDSWEEAR